MAKFVLLIGVLGLLQVPQGLAETSGISVCKDIFGEINRFDNAILKDILKSFNEIRAWPEEYSINTDKSDRFNFMIESYEGKFGIYLYPKLNDRQELKYSIRFYNFVLEDSFRYRSGDGSIQDDFDAIKVDFYSIPNFEIDDFLAGDIDKILNLIERRLYYLIENPHLFSKKLSVVN